MGLFSSLFSKKEKLGPADLSVLKVDMHSHLIPGIDDGSKSLDDTIGMLTKFKELGYSKIITTPHIMSDFYKNTPETILGGLEEVRKEVNRINLGIEIEAAAEYFYDETFVERLAKDDFLTFGKEKYVLIEFAFSSEPRGYDEFFFDMLMKDYRPVIAHFERYIFLHGSIDKAREWREKGIQIQLNLNSLSGHYGPSVKKQAEMLVDSGQIDFIASDCHRIDHLNQIDELRTNEYLHKVLELPLKNQFL
jgi:protein-tyrosine phosphatase